MNVRNFLEALDQSSEKQLFEGGNEGDKIDPRMKESLATAGIKYIWAFQPEGYDMVILEHDKDGEKSNSWSIAYFTESEVGGGPAKDVEDVFGESMITEAKVGFKVLDNPKGNFLDIVNLAIEIAGNSKYKQGFTAQNIKTLKKKK